MGIIVAMGCLMLRMSPEAALVAATRNAALAVGRGDRVGMLEPGKQKNLQLRERELVEQTPRGPATVNLIRPCRC